MINYEDSIENSTLSDDGVLLFVKGMYLLNGGTSADFDEFTVEDIQLMFSTWSGAQRRKNKMLGESLQD